MEQNNDDVTLFEKILAILFIIEFVGFIGLSIAAAWIGENDVVRKLLGKVAITDFILFATTLFFIKILLDREDESTTEN